MHTPRSPKERKERTRLAREKWVSDHNFRIASHTKEKTSSDGAEDEKLTDEEDHQGVERDDSIARIKTNGKCLSILKSMNAQDTTKDASNNLRDDERSTPSKHEQIVRREIDTYPHTLRKLFAKKTSDEDDEIVKRADAKWIELRASLQEKWNGLSMTNEERAERLDRFARMAFSKWHAMEHSSDGQHRMDDDVMRALCEGMHLRFDAVAPSGNLEFETFWEAFRKLVGSFDSTHRRILERRTRDLASFGHASDAGDADSTCRPCVFLRGSGDRSCVLL